MTGARTPFICATCGMQFAAGTHPPAHCPICEDERQYVAWSGQTWTRMQDLAAHHRVHIGEDQGLLALRLEPAFAIAQRALLIPAVGGHVMWESLSLVTGDAVEAILSRGPVKAIAVSHPHFYAAMVEWSIALGNVPIYLHEADRAWVMRPHENIRFWRGRELALCEGITLINVGGHFPGSTVLHWQDARRPAGALFPGDAAQVALDRRHVAFMYSYPNMIPLPAPAVSAMRERLRPYAFDDVFGYAWGRNIMGDARQAVDRSFDRSLRAMGLGEAAPCHAEVSR